MDYNANKMRKNAFRVTKNRGLTAVRIRVPGGHITGDLLGQVQAIADTYGNGEVHITSRQGFEILGIPFDKMDQVNKAVQPLIDQLNINQEKRGEGYSSSGTRNIAACIGNRVCPYGCYETTGFAKRIEKEVFPHDLHFKIALTGCPNDCQKVRMHDFGIIGMTEPQLDKDRCVNCGACEKYCRSKSVQAIKMVNGKPQRDEDKCIGCGVCVVYCPMRAWTRSKKKYYKLTLLGRTGKRNPRLGQDFIKWADEDSIVKIIKNTYDYVEEFIDPNAPAGKEHIGYIVDRTGFNVFKEWVMKGVDLPEKALVYQPMYWDGIHYDKTHTKRI
ncbi:MAG: sulfite reductase subunit C [Tissierellia bacterium]|nr:sulfite reductase subunit C [Tissierellia bacterium]